QTFRVTSTVRRHCGGSGVTRYEPAAARCQKGCSTKLSYTPEGNPPDITRIEPGVPESRPIAVSRCIPHRSVPDMPAGPRSGSMVSDPGARHLPERRGDRGSRLSDGTGRSLPDALRTLFSLVRRA